MLRGRRGAGLELSTTCFQEAPVLLINFRLIGNVFGTGQKQQIARDLTGAMVAIPRVRC
jgi:hypothetical protein